MWVGPCSAISFSLQGASAHLTPSLRCFLGWSQTAHSAGCGIARGRVFGVPLRRPPVPLGQSDNGLVPDSFRKVVVGSAARGPGFGHSPGVPRGPGDHAALLRLEPQHDATPSTPRRASTGVRTSKTLLSKPPCRSMALSGARRVVHQAVRVFIVSEGTDSTRRHDTTSGHILCAAEASHASSE